jgi:hypothetical protein
MFGLLDQPEHALGDVAAALAVSLGLVSLTRCAPRVRLLLCAAQAVLAAVAVLPLAPLIALLTAVFSGGGALFLSTRAPEPSSGSAIHRSGDSTSSNRALVAGMFLSAVVVLALPPELRARIGLGAAVAATGLLLASISRGNGRIAGFFVAQNGLALAAGWSSLPLEIQAAAAFPLLPGLSALVPVLELGPRFHRRAALLPRYVPATLDAAGSAAAFLASGAMLATTGSLGPWLAFLSAIAAALTAWAAPSPDQWSAFRRLTRLAGIILALLADNLVLGWLGFGLALTASRGGIRSAGIPAMLVLAGILLLCLAVPPGAAPAWTSLVGAPAAPDPHLIAIAAIPLLAGFLLPATTATPTDAAWSTLFVLALSRALAAIEPTPLAAFARHVVPSLALLGMVAFGALTCIAPLHSRIAGARTVQACAAAFALGLAGVSGRIAGVLQISLLILSLAAVRIAPGRPASWVALAGLAGIPPFGLFAGLALTGLAAARAPWMLLPFIAALMLNGWALLRDRDLTRAMASQAGPAWIAIALTLLLGFTPAAWIARMALAP